MKSATQPTDVTPPSRVSRGAARRLKRALALDDFETIAAASIRWRK